MRHTSAVSRQVQIAGRQALAARYGALQLAVDDPALLGGVLGMAGGEGDVGLVRADAGTLTSSLWSFTRDGKERVGLLLMGEAGRGQYRATLGIQGLE